MPASLSITDRARAALHSARPEARTNPTRQAGPPSAQTAALPVPLTRSASAARTVAASHLRAWSARVAARTMSALRTLTARRGRLAFAALLSLTTRRPCARRRAIAWSIRIAALVATARPHGTVVSSVPNPIFATRRATPASTTRTARKLTLALTLISTLPARTTLRFSIGGAIISCACCRELAERGRHGESARAPRRLTSSGFGSILRRCGRSSG